MVYINLLISASGGLDIIFLEGSWAIIVLYHKDGLEDYRGDGSADGLFWLWVQSKQNRLSSSISFNNEICNAKCLQVCLYLSSVHVLHWKNSKAWNDWSRQTAYICHHTLIRGIMNSVSSVERLPIRLLSIVFCSYFHCRDLCAVAVTSNGVPSCDVPKLSVIKEKNFTHIQLLKEIGSSTISHLSWKCLCSEAQLSCYVKSEIQVKWCNMILSDFSKYVTGFWGSNL